MSNIDDPLGRARVRLLALGDEFIAGVGDPKSLGWLGRVTARTFQSMPIDTYSSAIPCDTTSNLVARARHEVTARFDPKTSIDGAGLRLETRCVVGLGHGDLVNGVTPARARLNLATLLDSMRSDKIPAFVVGPPPTLDPNFNEQIGEISRVYGDVAQRRGVPYVETFAPLVSHDQWHHDLAAAGSVYPSQAGYGLMAWLVLHGGWFPWLGVEDPATHA
ncbi:lysophospholipase [Micrococcales bacterium 31B]|nr:lysophospholipase [Micrococcales bacterium 31B]